LFYKLKKKLAIITSHPIQYNAPLFELLQQRNHIDLHVFYTWGKEVLENKYDPGFEKEIVWDIPLLNGYEYTFLKNIAADKGSHHFKGIQNPGIIEAIEQYKPDAILLYGWAFKSHLKVLKHFKHKIPLLFRGDSTLLDKINPAKKILRNFFLRWVYRKIDIALYAGINNRLYFKAAGVKDEQLVFMPHAVDNQRFHKWSANHPDFNTGFKHELGIADTDFIFLFAGKLECKKSPELLLESFLNGNFESDIHLVFAGDGNLFTALKEKAKTNKHVHFTGFINQNRIPEIYLNADVVILPSAGPGETWGLAINEAMACSKPVIVSDCCGCAADLVDEDVNGYVFSAGNKKDLLDKMKKMIEKRLTLKQMGASSFNIITEYSFEKAAETIENTLTVKLKERS
jgi:glycosyltransferase involved in cell wall biosynthesis